MFVQPIFLAALAALGIPFVVHLIFRRRTKEVTLGTLRFLKIVLQENARKKRVMRWLLLCLRLACVALLAFVFARPFLLASGEASKENATVILIDRSASMMLKNNGRRLLDQAIADAQGIVAEHEDNARVEVAFFDQKVWPTPVDKLKQASADAMFGPTNYGAALAWAHDVLGQEAIGRKQLHIFTDLQQSGLDWSDVDPLPVDISVTMHDLGREQPNNIALTSVAIARTHVRPGEATTAIATVFNAGPFALEELPVEMKLKSGSTTLPVGRQKIRLESGAVETVKFDVPPLEEGLWTGTVAIETRDDLAFDNHRHVAINVAPPYSVLVLDGDPNSTSVMSESYYLHTALRLAPKDQTYERSPYVPHVVKFRERARLPSLDGYAIVVMANVPSVKAADAQLLAEFVHSGGGLVVFTGDNVSPASYQAFDEVGLSPGTFVCEEHTNDLPWRLHGWDAKHSVFRPFADPQHGDLRRLAFRAYTRIEPAQEAAVLATFDGGDPCVIEVAHGKGQVLWFASSCDRQWSDWSRGRLFVPLVHQMLGYLTGLTDGGPVRDELLDGTHASPEHQTPGVYQQDRYWQVLNVVPRESEMERCTIEDFVNRFGITLVDEVGETTPVATEQTRPEMTDAVRAGEYWHWVLLGLMGVLTAEFFVANRTTV